MTLKRNAMYKTNDGYIIPRSLFSDSMPRYAIVEELAGGDDHFIKVTTTYTAKDFRRVLNLSAKEKIEIL